MNTAINPNSNLLKDILMSSIREDPKWTKTKAGPSFKVTSDGTTGQEWGRHLKKKGCSIDFFARDLLLSQSFKPTINTRTKVVVLRRKAWSKMTYENVRESAGNLGLIAPHAEVACLICEKFTNRDMEAMGLSSIVVMHEPVTGSSVKLPDEFLVLLRVGRGELGNPKIGTIFTLPNRRVPLDVELGHDKIGFAFAAPR